MGAKSHFGPRWSMMILEVEGDDDFKEIPTARYGKRFSSLSRSIPELQDL
jgi:hypothetical protein